MAAMGKDIDDLCKKLNKFRISDSKDVTLDEISNISKSNARSIAPTREYSYTQSRLQPTFTETQNITQNTNQQLNSTKPKLLSTAQHLSFDSFHNSQFNQASTVDRQLHPRSSNSNMGNLNLEGQTKRGN